MRRAVTALVPFFRHAALRVWEPWRDFWFKPADPTPLAVMRILVGGMLVYTHLVWGLNLEGFFGPHGWQSETLVRAAQQDQFAWSFWWWVPGGLRMTVHVLAIVLLVCNMLGACTPATSILAYLITVSYAYRAPMANYGLDQMNAISALYLAIGPSGQVLSLDRLWFRYRTARSRLSAGLTPAIRPVAPSVRANLAIRLFQVHLCVMYVFACLSKLQGESWWGGQAIWQAVSNLEYQSCDLTWLAWYPWLVNLLTHATIVWEMTFWALVWRPLCRPVVLLVGVAIHLGIGAFMGMWTFGLAVIFMYVSFIPPHTLKAVLAAVARPISKLSATLGWNAAAVADVRVKALRSALGFDSLGGDVVGDSMATAQLNSSQEIPSTEPLSTDSSSIVATIDVSEAVAEQSDARRPLEPVETELAVPGHSLETASPPPESRAPAVESGHRDFPRVRTRPRPRPSLVVVESRLKRQTQIQEYLVQRGFRCFVASDLHQARSLLSVVDIDVLVVTSSWFPDEEIEAFRDALVSGGSSLPASIFLLTPANRKLAERLEESGRHRLIRGTVSLRELRLLVLEVLGLPEQALTTFESRSARSGRSSRRPPRNGHRTEPAPSEPTPASPESEPSESLAAEVGRTETGTQT